MRAPPEPPGEPLRHAAADPGERPGPIARLREEISALERAYSPGHHGRWSARRRAELVDACCIELFAADAPEGVALAALGGYGRGELCPASDIDLLVLHPGEDHEGLAGVVERLLYPLWDAGLVVGQAVRTPEECLAFAAGRLDAATAMLDARFLAGDRDRFEEATSFVLGWVREDPRGFAARLSEAATRRRERFGSGAYLLEPDVKEGGGGLRDVQTLAWLGVALGETPGLPTLDGVGLLRSSEREAVDAAEEFLVRVRSALHLETGRKADRLHLDQQPQIARDMGFVDEPGLPAVDGLMRALFEHARQVEHVRDAAFERFLADRPGTAVGWDPEAIDPTAESVMVAFADAAEAGGAVPPAVLDRIESLDLPEEILWSEPVRGSFLRVLRAGRAGVRALEAMDRIGLLAAFLPAWAAVRCRPQRDPYHRFTVDVHLLETLARMAALLEDPAGEGDRIVQRAVAIVGDHDALLLGALLHDVGKTGEGRHVPAGARIAAATLEHIGIGGPTGDLVRFLVEQHLLLPDTATRRDLGDEDLVLDVAAVVATPERLAALYLLAVADAAATGPHAWTPWRQALVRELVAKVQHVLERGEMGIEAAQRLEERASELRRLLAGEDPAEVERFLSRMPPTYVLAVDPAVAASHFPLVFPALGALEVRTAAGPGPRAGTYACTIVAADRPGLLSMIAGALSLAGLSILTAQVFTTEDDVAVDVFEVQGAFEPEVGEERWRTFRQTLRKVLEGRLALDHRVAEKRRHYPAPRAQIPVRVEVDNEASDFFTVIEVGGPDRIGFLFDVTRTFAELQLDVHLAKVATFGARVVDAFYVRDALGQKVEDPEHVAEIERALRARLEG